jgi:hypothetical protein
MLKRSTFALVILTACQPHDELAPKGGAGPFRSDSVSIVPVSAEEQERSARHLPRCPLVPPDPDWITQRDSRGRVEWRVPNIYSARPYVDDEERIIWVGGDSSWITLNFHAGDGNTSSMASPADSVRTMVDDGWCSMRFAGRVAAVAMYRLVMARGDTLHAAAVDAGIQPGFGLGAASLSRSHLARDKSLAAIATLKLLR